MTPRRQPVCSFQRKLNTPLIPRQIKLIFPFLPGGRGASHGASVDSIIHRTPAPHSQRVFQQRVDISFSRNDNNTNNNKYVWKLRVPFFLFSFFNSKIIVQWQTLNRFQTSSSYHKETSPLTILHEQDLSKRRLDLVANTRAVVELKR